MNVLLTQRICLSSLILCLSAVLLPHAARGEIGQAVSPDHFGQLVDIVTPGYLHWNKASGDTVDPDSDANDLDNNFGEHAGGVDAPSLANQAKAYGQGSVEAEFMYVHGENTAHWEFHASGPGSYVFVTLLWRELSEPVRIVFSYKRGQAWIDLPVVEGVREWPDFGRLGCWRIDVPEGQTTVPMRVRAESGRGLIYRMLLGKMRTESLFIEPAVPAEHPNLYFKAEDLPALRQKVRTGPPKLAYDYMVKSFPRYKRRFEKSDWRINGAHLIGRSIIQTAFLHVMTGEEIYLKTVLKMIEKMMSWPHEPDAIKQTMEGTYGILDRGRRLSAIVLAYDWLYHKIPPKRREVIRKFIDVEANRLYVYNECMVGQVESGNWGPWIGAGYGMAGVLLRNEHKCARNWIDSQKRIFELNLRASHEDFGYFMNGFTKALDFGICLITATGEDVFKPSAERLRALLDYRMTLLTPQRDGYPTFGDASGKNDPVLALCNSVYLGDAMAQWFINHLSCADPKQVSSWGWEHMMPVAVVRLYQPGLKEEAPSTPRLSLAKSFSESPDVSPGLRPVTVLRTGYDRASDIQFSLRCGEFAGWHGHPAQGSFMLNAYGDHMTLDRAMGAPYGTPRSDFSKSAQAHSCVIIDGKGQEKYSDPVYGYNLEAGHQGPLLHTDFVDYISTDNAEAYRKNPLLKALDRANRHFIMVRKPKRHAYVVIVDDIQLDDQLRQYEWLLQTDTAHSVSTKAPGHQLIGGKAELHVFTTAPAEVVASQADKFDTWRTLKIKAAAPTAQGRFVTVLYPKTAKMPLPAVKRLAGATAVGSRVGTDQDNETILFATGGEPIDVAGIVSDGKLVALGFKGGNVDWLLCVDGTSMEVDGQRLFQSDKPVTIALNADRTGHILASQPSAVRIIFGGIEPVDVDAKAGSWDLQRGQIR